MKTISTTAPLPDLATFLAALTPTLADDAALSAPWVGPDDKAFLLSRASWALYAVVRAVGAARSRMPVVWIPAYFCAHALIPLRSIAQVVFYAVTEDLEPDWNDCATEALRTPPDVFISVHYFGRAADVAAARQFCDVRGAILLEDASHALTPLPGIGDAGDAVIWSLYKHLPLPDGGLLSIRPTGALDPDDVATTLCAMSAAAPSYHKWIAKRFMQWLWPAAAGGFRAPSLPFDFDPDKASFDEQAGMSAMARRLLAHAQRQLPAIAERRRQNMIALSGAIVSSTDLVPFCSAQEGTWIPYRAIFRAADHWRAKFWYDRLIAPGNVVETWPDLPQEVKANAARYSTALKLRGTVLMLPIHADRDAEDLVGAYCVLRS